MTKEESLIAAGLPGWTRPADANAVRMMAGLGVTPHAEDAPLAFLSPAGWVLVGRDPFGREHSVVRQTLPECIEFLRSLITVELPGLPDPEEKPPAEEWHEGTMPGGRDVRFTELDYELTPDVAPLAPEPPLAGDAGGGAPSDAAPVDGVADPGGAGDPGDVEVGVEGGEGVPESTPEAPSSGTTYPGVALTIDQRRNELSIEIDEQCEDRIDARATPGWDGRLAELLSMQQGAQEKALPPLTDEQQAELNRLHALDTWINRMRAYGAATRKALRTWPREQLDDFDVAAADWPAFPA